MTVDTAKRASAATPSSRDQEHTLAARIAEGDSAAFEQVMRRYNRRLYRIARATLNHDEEAEDALQESYIRAYRSIAQFQGDASLFTWLARIVLNECFARQRRSARRQNIIPITASVSELDGDAMSDSKSELPDETLFRSEIRNLIEQKLEQLPYDFRTVFVLRAVEEMTVEETAALLQIPEPTVRSRLFRARSLLREALAREIDLAERDVFEFAGARCDRIVRNVLARLALG